MKYKEAKEELIQAWGNLGSSWGLNKTMAQIHALLMISPKPLSTEEIMEELSISRGNANMNIRALLDWGIAYRILVPGERKEYFKSEKDVWTLARQVVKERRKRELEPILKTLKAVSDVESDGTEETKELKRMVKDLKSFGERSDQLLDVFAKSEEGWFWNTILKIFK
jgi:DNA-binding transcriptional regulator GbsR (MarR family)